MRRKKKKGTCLETASSSVLMYSLGKYNICTSSSTWNNKKQKDVNMFVCLLSFNPAFFHPAHLLVYYSFFCLATCMILSSLWIAEHFTLSWVAFPGWSDQDFLWENFHLIDSCISGKNRINQTKSIKSYLLFLSHVPWCWKVQLPEIFMSSQLQRSHQGETWFTSTLRCD